MTEVVRVLKSVRDQDLVPSLAQILECGIGAKDSRRAARTFDRALEVRLALRVALEIRKVLRIVLERLQRCALLDHDEARGVRHETPFLEIYGERVGIAQLAEPVDVVPETRDRRRIDRERIGVEIVI